MELDCTRRTGHVPAEAQVGKQRQVEQVEDEGGRINKAMLLSLGCMVFIVLKVLIRFPPRISGAAITRTVALHQTPRPPLEGQMHVMIAFRLFRVQ